MYVVHRFVGVRRNKGHWGLGYLPARGNCTVVQMLGGAIFWQGTFGPEKYT